MYVVDVTEQAVKPELGAREVDLMRKEQEAMYLSCSLLNVKFLERLDKRELTHRESLLDFVELLLSHPPYNVRSSREDFDSHWDVLALEAKTETVALSKRLMRPEAHGHLFCAALQLGQRYRMLSKASEEKDSESDGDEHIEIKEAYAKKNAVFIVEGLPLP